jgi:predicted ArsR family transcriptional regulator
VQADTAAAPPAEHGCRDDLVDLLGEARAAIVGVLRQSPCTVAELASRVGTSEVAVRRHLQVLADSELVATETVRRNGPGRPSVRYRLSDRGRQLSPDRHAEVAREALEFLEGEYGRDELLRFLQWRAERREHRYRQQLHHDGATDSATVLAQLLTEDGYAAEVRRAPGAETGTAQESAPDAEWELRQGCCAIAEIAEQHPEVCAYERQMFERLLGASLTRRQTIAEGASECVCEITTETMQASDAPAQPGRAGKGA